MIVPPKTGAVSVLPVSVCVSAKVTKVSAGIYVRELVGAVVELGMAGILSEDAKGPLVSGQP